MTGKETLWGLILRFSLYFDGFNLFFGDGNIKTGDKNKSRFYGVLAGVERIELPSTVLETGMLPLYHTPSTMKFYHSDADFAILILNFV